MGKESIHNKHLKLQNDLAYFCQHAPMMIKQKSGKLAPLIFNKAQRYIDDRLEKQLRETGRVDEFMNSEGELIRRQAKPLVKMKNDALNNALKLASQFGITPSARASISAPQINNNTQINNYFE